MAYTCKSCGAVANAPGHLCNPCGDKAKCSFCGATETDHTHQCKDKLAAYKLPTEVEFMDDLPKTNVGKVLKKDLRAEELAKRGQ